MSAIVINPFVGEEIREQKLSKENLAAVCAENAQLHDGALRPWPCPELVCTHEFEPRTIYTDADCDCVAFRNETLIDATHNFTFWAERGHTAKKSNCFCDGDQDCSIGIPCPTQAMSASGGGSECGFDPHVYYYTWVAKYCNGCESEGPLSPPSNQVCGPARVGGGDGVPSGHCITHTRIYRSTAGWKPGDENNIQNNSTVTLVAEVPAGSGVSDNISIGSSPQIHPITYRMRSMPSDLVGVGVSGFGLFGWKGNKLYISADGMPDVMFESGEYTFFHDVVSAAYWGGSIYVFTEKWSYRIDEASGEGGARYSNPPYRFELLAPIKDAYSVAVGNTGVYYISENGIVIVAGNDAVNIGSSLFTTPQWKTMRLDNAKIHIYQQYLFLYSRDWDYAHMFQIEDGAYTDIAYSNHTRYSYSISAMHTTPSGELLFASGNDVYRFREGECYDMTACDAVPPLCQECCGGYRYEIPLRNELEITDWASAFLHIDAHHGDVTFRYWDGQCGDKLLLEKTLSGCDLHEFKLPGCIGLSKYHTVELSGCAIVYEMRISTDNKEMGLNRS